MFCGLAVSVCYGLMHQPAFESYISGSHVFSRPLHKFIKFTVQ